MQSTGPLQRGSELWLDMGPPISLSRFLISSSMLIEGAFTVGMGSSTVSDQSAPGNGFWEDQATVLSERFAG